jgi:hypothetical protein
LFALELNMIRESLWNRAGEGFADVFASDQLGFQWALFDWERFYWTFCGREQVSGPSRLSRTGPD